MIDPAELAELRDLARRVSRRIVSTVEDAEDIAQEAVLRAMQDWARIGSYARPWVVRVATNLAIAQLRRDGRSHDLVLPQASPDSHIELRVDLAQAVRALPVRQRQAVVLRYLADHDEATVADLLGCSRGSVKRHLHRATRALRESSRLISHAPREEVTMTARETGQDRWVPAVMPVEGWPARPWDHWVIEHDGSWDRVAVDAAGDPILDADGDEVMSGPGFDHEVVKVVPGIHEEPPDPRPLWATRLAPGARDIASRLPDDVIDLLDRALVLAGWFGHPWVGDEHVALALAEDGEVLGISSESLRDAVAHFYEGPFADARLAIVRSRAAGTPFVRQPESAFSWTWALLETLGIAQQPREFPEPAPPLTTADIATALLTKKRSLIEFLLARRPG